MLCAIYFRAHLLDFAVPAVKRKSRRSSDLIFFFFLSGGSAFIKCWGWASDCCYTLSNFFCFAENMTDRCLRTFLRSPLNISHGPLLRNVCNLEEVAASLWCAEFLPSLQRQPDLTLSLWRKTTITGIFQIYLPKIKFKKKKIVSVQN